MNKYKLLVINLGGTSTKVGVYVNEKPLHVETIRHDTELLTRYPDFWDQYDSRKETILRFLANTGHDIATFDAIVSRGAPVKPIPSGTYYISQDMIADAKSRKYGNHPTSVGAKIALDLGEAHGIPALTVDPPCIDELIYQARYTGIPSMTRKSYYQALNQKATGRKLARELDKPYEAVNLVICHIGSGLSIAAHRKGKVIDVNNGLDGDGPLAMERAGTVPAGDLARLCFSGKYTFEEVYGMINGRGGICAYLGTKDGLEVEKRAKAGDKLAREIYDTMAYQIAQAIGACAVSLCGQVDAVALTGGLAYSDYLTKEIFKWCGFLGRNYIFPGEDEMESLVAGVLRCLRGSETICNYRQAASQLEAESPAVS